ncbi:kinase-like protein [Thozetella sp. PMI_491]|nr:kinase-like protein [Thozetella sp. PMI_491]
MAPTKIVIVDAHQREFRELQRRQRSYFKYWRTGNSLRWNERALKPTWRRYRIPRPGKWEGIESKKDLAPPVGPPAARLSLHEVTPARGEPAQDHRGVIEPRARAVAGVLDAYEIRLNRVLGWGGLGLAALFDIREDGEDPLEWKKVVIKCDLVAPAPGEDYLVEEEKAWHRLFQTAKHLVQEYRFTDTEEPVRARPVTRNMSKRGQRGVRLMDQRSALNEARSMLAMEYLEHGSLAKCIKKLNDRQEQFSNRQLWMLADCLFRAIIGMAHPPRLQAEAAGEELGEDLIDEALPPPHQAPVMSDDIIHFDLEPSNILIGGIARCNGHDAMPTFKVGDFGIMADMRELKEDSDYKHATPTGSTPSTVGSGPHCTPEQFTEEWDYIRDMPFENQRVRVAGNYTWKTNLYQFGTTLWSVVTGYGPPPPFAALDPFVADHVWDAAASQYRYVWSYATGMQDPAYDDIDAKFRDLIVDCMKERPDDRPEMRAIEQLIRRKLAQAWPNRRQDSNWAKDFWQSPGPPPPQTENNLKRFLNGQITLAQYQPAADGNAGAGAGGQSGGGQGNNNQQDGADDDSDGLSDDSDEGGGSGDEYETSDDEEEEEEEEEEDEEEE